MLSTIILMVIKQMVYPKQSDWNRIDESILKYFSATKQINPGEHTNLLSAEATRDGDPTCLATRMEERNDSVDIM